MRLIERLEQFPDKIIDLEKLKELTHRNSEKPGKICPLSKKVLKVLVPSPSSGTITLVRKAEI